MISHGVNQLKYLVDQIFAILFHYHKLTYLCFGSRPGRHMYNSDIHISIYSTFKTIYYTNARYDEVYKSCVVMGDFIYINRISVNILKSLNI